MTSRESLTAEWSETLLTNILPGLQRLDALLAQASNLAPETHGPTAAADRFRGLYISQEESAHILNQKPGEPRLYSNGHVASLALSTAPSRLDWLREMFQLSPFDLDIILLALAPELDRRYERLYAYLQDHVGRRWPTVDLALHLLCSDAAARLSHRSHFNPDAPLIHHQLIHLIPENDHRPTSLLSHFMQLDEQITRFLLGQDGLDNRLATFCHHHHPPQASPLLHEATQQGLIGLIDEAWTTGSPMRLYLYGPASAGKRQVAQNAAAFLELPCLIADLSRIPPTLPLAEALTLIWRYARFYKTIPYLEGVDNLTPASRVLLRVHLRQNPHLPLIILAGSEPWPPPDDDPDDVLSIAFNLTDYMQRRTLWQAHLSQYKHNLSLTDVETLAGRFRLWPTQIAQAVIAAANQVRWQAAIGQRPARAHLTVEDCFRSARTQSGHDLLNLATKIEPLYTWDDIVLPAAARTQLHEICQQLVHRHTVLGQWGFGQRLSLGKGVNALFAGPSGTGKTMAADIIANELGLELYKIDLSGIVSKYIGETEKNLERIFRAAENANAILFFDEADALFGKRSEVRDSHDRYANIEISYLLQKIEAYDGLAILASNLRQNLDEAFIRRLAFTIHFPFPDEASRRQIWATIWPDDTPLADDVDLDHLAHQFKLSGGNIKNVALAAAYLAVTAGQAIGMGHLLQAVRREYQKMGKRMSEDEMSLAAARGQHG
ncbi:MAG: ATP-binding protein [Anaerolineae bacterium]|nr:ATP-binding protein [Anaerolineae bacterium]